MRLFPVLGDQLSRDLASLREFDPAQDVVLMMEVQEEATYVPHHPQKIALIFSAMRHYAEELRSDGIEVRYVPLDDPDNQGSFFGEVNRACADLGAESVVATWPGEYRVLEDMRRWEADLGLPVQILEDDRFLCSREDFAGWAEGRKQLRMEFFYREMRRKTGLLMDGPDPVGGQWNFDADNRKKMPSDEVVPAAFGVAADPITKDVLALVEARFSDHFGALDGFDQPVTRVQALAALDDFVAHRLSRFGDFQDAMRRDKGQANNDSLFHSLLAPALNLGLLEPLEVCRAAERAYLEGRAPLNAVEGFIRQIIGWREFVRGIYWLTMPGYAARNTFGAKRPLPSFFWDGKTDMACVAHAVDQTRRRAYAHHIQRLMVTGNLALIAGLDPAEVNRWYLSV
ncbi:MAG: cryptochrome/photolyase family protein, partial [Alphaproteobacteria bacterium]